MRLQREEDSKVKLKVEGVTRETEKVQTSKLQIFTKSVQNRLEIKENLR